MRSQNKMLWAMLFATTAITTRAAAQGRSTVLRLYSPLEPFFTKAWRPSEIELVK